MSRGAQRLALRAGWAGHSHTEREPLEQVSFEQSENVAIALASWATESSEASGSVLLNCSLSYLFKETSTIASTLERSEERHGPQDCTQAGLRYRASREAIGEVTVFCHACLNRSALQYRRLSGAKRRQSFRLALLAHHALTCSEGCGLQVRLYLRMLIHFNSGNSARNTPCKL